MVHPVMLFHLFHRDRKFTYAQESLSLSHRRISNVLARKLKYFLQRTLSLYCSKVIRIRVRDEKTALDDSFRVGMNVAK